MTQNDIDQCDEFCVHIDKIEKVNIDIPEETEMCDIAELFKVFGDSTRIRILYALYESELCVCDLSQELSMKQPAISHQLKILRMAKLVASRRDGKTVYYSLADDHVRTIIAMGREHIEEQ